VQITAGGQRTPENRKYIYKSVFLSVFSSPCSTDNCQYFVNVTRTAQFSQTRGWYLLFYVILSSMAERNYNDRKRIIEYIFNVPLISNKKIQYDGLNIDLYVYAEDNFH
jgi:hypothetical protein